MEFVSIYMTQKEDDTWVATIDPWHVSITGNNFSELLRLAREIVGEARGQRVLGEGCREDPGGQ